MIRQLTTLLAGAVCLVAAPLSATGASRVEVTSHVRPNRAAVGDQLTLSVKVTVVSEGRGWGISGTPYQAYRHPDLSQFNITRQWNQSSAQITIVGGRAQREHHNVYYYTIEPKRTGALKIGTAQVTYKGQTYRSNTLTVQVGAGPAPPPPTLPGQTPTNLNGDEDLFIQVVPDKLTAWAGEQITVTWYLYFLNRLGRSPTFKKIPSTDNFFSEDIPFRSQNTTQTTIKGQVYNVMPIYRRALFPLKPGRLKVGALAIEAWTVSGRYYNLVPTTRASAELTITARALPTQGVPTGFHQNNVGRFKVTTELDPYQIDAHGATSLRVVVRGKGFMHGLKVDKIKHLDGWKVRFAGQKTEMASTVQLSGTRIHEYVLIPVQVGKVRVPPVCFVHFNPQQGRYVTTACSQPQIVTVTGRLPTAVTGGGATVASGPLNELRQEIKPILKVASLKHRSPWRLYRSGWLMWLVLLLPAFGLGGLLVFRRVKASLDQDTESRRRRQARGRARKRLRLASSYLKGNDRVGFFTEISNVIQDLLSARLGVRVQGLTVTDLQALLSGSGMAAALQERLIRDLEICDLARFAPAAAEEQEMQAVLQRTRRLIVDIERAKLKTAPEDALASAEASP